MTEPTPLSRYGESLKAYEWPIPRLEMLRRQADDLSSKAAQRAYMIGLEEELRALLVSEKGTSADTKRMDFICTLEGQYFISRLVAGLTPEQVRNTIDAQIRSQEARNG